MFIRTLLSKENPFKKKTLTTWSLETQRLFKTTMYQEITTCPNFNSFKICCLPVSLPVIIRHDTTSSKAICSSRQVIFQTAAQTEIWWIALHCDTATHHRQMFALLAVIVVTLFFFSFPLQLMERIKSQINEINIVCMVCVHWFSTLPVPLLMADLIVQSFKQHGEERGNLF